MKFWPAAVCALVLSACATPALADDGKTAGWVTDYAKARAAARASGKPIFLVLRCER